MKLITGWLTCKSGTRDEFLALMRDPAEATRREPGCVFFEFHPHADDPDMVVIIEGYHDAAAHEAHRHTSHMAVMQGEIGRLLIHVRLCNVEAEQVTWDEYDFIANPPGPGSHRAGAAGLVGVAPSTVLVASPSSALRAPSPIKGEGPTERSRLYGLLPSWEKVGEARMRGRPHPQTPLHFIRRSPRNPLPALADSRKIRKLIHVPLDHPHNHPAAAV